MSCVYLAIETTESIGSLAAMEDRNLLLELDLEHGQRSAQSLAPGLRRLLDQVGWTPAQVDLVAVTIGPGSFTGLRIGVATAKVFAYAVGAEVLGIDTLEAIATGVPAEVPSVSAVIDAQRGDVVAKSFRRGPDGCFLPTGAATLIDVDAWIEGLPPGAVVTGPVLRKLADRVPPGVTVLDPRYWPPTAGNVARLAARLHAAGRRDDIWNLVPHYSRRAAAEEKWEQRQP